MRLFPFPEARLSSRSLLFRNALKQPQVQQIHNCKAVEFSANVELFLHYRALVLLDKIEIPCVRDVDWEAGNALARNAAIDARFHALFELFLLCERVGDGRGRNMVIEEVARQSLTYYDTLDREFELDGNPAGCCKVLPQLREVDSIYKITPSASMRRLLVDMFAHSPQYCIAVVQCHAYEFESRFLHDLSNRFFELVHQHLDQLVNQDPEHFALPEAMGNSGWHPGLINVANYYEWAGIDGYP